MEKLTSLIHNFNTDCHKQYTKVSPLLGDLLNESLGEIEKFYYSSFWINRFKRRLKEENIDYNPIRLDIIQGLTSELREDTKFKMFTENSEFNGRSNTMIALNTNMSKDKLNDSHINNVIMHEFGHVQYNQKEFKLIVDLNKKIIGTPITNESLNKEDYKYFTDHNEIRQRIIPIIKEMYDNGWKLGEVYDKSENLKTDDIKDIFSRDYILKLIDNLL